MSCSVTQAWIASQGVGDLIARWFIFTDFLMEGDTISTFTITTYPSDVLLITNTGLDSTKSVVQFMVECPEIQGTLEAFDIICGIVTAFGENYAFGAKLNITEAPGTPCANID